MMTCVSPRAGAEQTVSVEVSNNGTDVTSSGIQFSSWFPPTLHRVFSSSVCAYYSHVLTVFGTNFKANKHVVMMDYDFPCNNFAFQGSNLSCEIQVVLLLPGNYTLHLSVNGFLYHETQHVVSVVGSPIILILSALRAPLAISKLILGSSHNLEHFSGGSAQVFQLVFSRNLSNL